MNRSKGDLLDVVVEYGKIFPERTIGYFWNDYPCPEDKFSDLRRYGNRLGTGNIIIDKDGHQKRFSSFRYNGELLRSDDDYRWAVVPNDIILEFLISDKKDLI